MPSIRYHQLDRRIPALQPRQVYRGVREGGLLLAIDINHTTFEKESKIEIYLCGYTEIGVYILDIYLGVEMIYCISRDE